MKKDIFVFPNIMHIDGRIKLNTDKDIYELTYSQVIDNKTVNKKAYINPSVIVDGNVAMVLYSPITNSLIVHYGYSALCEAMNVTHSEFLKVTNLYGFMQLDRYKDRVFIKVFLPHKQYSLDSDTDDYSDNAYLTADCIHPVDWQYIPTFDTISAKVNKNNKLLLSLGVCSPAVKEAEGNMYINYAGQVAKLKDGVCTYEFEFIKGENAYIGYPYSRRKGRMIEIGRLLMLCDK